MSLPAAGESIAEQVSAFACAVTAAELPASVMATVNRQLLDVVGLCVAARNERYVESVLRSMEAGGRSTLIGHNQRGSPSDAALVNGTAAHGEDFDDTFEGTPVHAGAVVVPAVLAVCEHRALSNERAVVGIACGVELMCRLALVAPTAIHRAGFHPTAVIGAMGASLGVATALNFDARATTSALGIAASTASGIIEYLAEGTWTKRLHAGWAAHCGVRAGYLAGAGFLGPRTVFEGRHGFFHAFTNTDVTPDYSVITAGLGAQWLMQGVAFKPYPCGTMAQPFIDCALRARARGIEASDIESICCDVGEGTVHRLWEPIADKQHPASSYGAKFSVPFAIAVALVDGAAGLEQFTDAKVRDPDVIALAARIDYRVNPEDEYPRNYTGHLHIRLKSGECAEFRQPHLRGGRREPLSDEEIERKFRANMRFGGCDDVAINSVLDGMRRLRTDFDAVDLSFLRDL